MKKQTKKIKCLASSMICKQSLNLQNMKFTQKNLLNTQNVWK